MGRPEPVESSRPFIDRDDVEAVVRVLGTPHLTRGGEVPAFEEGLARVTGAAHAVACASGTLALQAAYLALGVERGTRVVTTANTFLATATAALHCGAEVGFVDVDARDANLDLDELEARLAGPRGPEVVTVVHFAGLPVDMGRVLALKRRHGFRLVEDASHALGARYRAGGRWWRVGEHPEVDATTLSFHPVKHITTGEGGAVLTHDAELAARLRRTCDHGVDREGAGVSGAPMVELGLNGRLSELHAALGRSQLVKLPEFLAARREIASSYAAALDGYECLSAGDADREHAWHLFVVRVDARERDELLAALRAQGIGCQVHYHPVPRQPWFERHHGGGSWPRAEDHARRSLSLPIFPALSEQDQERVVCALEAWRRFRRAA